ncbi:hypothetical protein D3C84_1084060 [compost metagenome]
MYSIIKFKWDDKTRMLTIENREGAFPGMLKSRIFKIIVAGANRVVGDSSGEPVKNISYNGKKIVLKL